ncbi:hypothetical protein BDW75DRAFT_1621 [Aspergillus navahoensis]
MSNQIVPTEILKKKRLSQQEYDLREKRAPESVNKYQVIPNKHMPTPQLSSRPQPERRTWQPQGAEKQQTESQHLPHHQVITVSNANANTSVQCRVPSRRSLLFEEWKARSLRSPEQMKEAGFSSTAVRKGNNIETNRSTTSGDVRVLLGERFDKAGSGRVKGKPVNDGRGQQPESIDARNKATSGDGRSQVVEHISRSTNVHAKSESANKDPIQHPKAEKTRDKAMSKDGRAPLGEHSDKAADLQATTRLDVEGYIQQTEAAKIIDTTTPNSTRGQGRKNSKRATSVQAKTSLTNDGYNQQPQVKPENVNEECHTPTSSSKNTNTPLVTPGPNTGKKGAKGRKTRGRQEDPERQSSRGRRTSHECQSSQGHLPTQELRPSKEPQPSQAPQSAHAQQPFEYHQGSQARQPSKGHQGSRARHSRPSRQSSIERQQHSRGRLREPAVYTALNGTQFGMGELRRLAHGVRIIGNVKVYFIPCFIEDPWRDVKPVPCIRPSDLMSRF